MAIRDGVITQDLKMELSFYNIDLCYVALANRKRSRSFSAMQTVRVIGIFCDR